jgi:hypothetical protein
MKPLMVLTSTLLCTVLLLLPVPRAGGIFAKRARRARMDVLYVHKVVCLSYTMFSSELRILLSMAGRLYLIPPLSSLATSDKWSSCFFFISFFRSFGTRCSINDKDDFLARGQKVCEREEEGTKVTTRGVLQ